MSPLDPDDTAGVDGPALLQGLLDVLDLQPQGVDQQGQDLYVGVSQPQPHGRVFGGQVLGQTLVAAGRTVPVRCIGARWPGRVVVPRARLAMGSDGPPGVDEGR